MEDNFWHSFENASTFSLYCISAPGKLEALQGLVKCAGFVYVPKSHFYACWDDDEQLCKSYVIDKTAWDNCLKHMFWLGSIKAEFTQDNMNVIIANYVSSKVEATEQYGVTCGKCNQYYPHAILTNGFKCWGCRNGY